MANALSYDVFTPESCCGVVEFGTFFSRSNYKDNTYTNIKGIQNHLDTAAFGIAYLINNNACKAFYDLIKDNFLIVGQTEPYKNPNSINYVFAVIFRNKE